MSDGDVSLIRDEDLLRRMWQQTEDFSRKKEIRAHMYRLREERLRSLYSPEPAVNPAKGCEFSSTQGHVKSFADQSFQSMKSKEVRDAGSPPKEFTYRGQDLKDLSNAGWNVESENKTTDDGHTHMKSVNANIEGRYDVDGGKGYFSAADHHKQAVTEYNDDNASLKRNEDYSNTSAHEQVVRQTGDGMHFTSTSSSSSSASKFEQVSSKHETVPYLSNDDYDASQKPFETNRNEEISTQKISKTSNYEQSLRNDCEQGELVSRKIDYPDDNTKVIVETRRLPDGTRVTSTRREFHAPSVQTSRSEHHSQEIRNESKATSYTTSQKRFHANESKQTIQDSIDRNVQDIVDSQRTKDDHDFRTNNVSDYSDDISHRRYHQDKKTTEINERKLTRHEDQNIRQHDVKEIHQYKNIEDSNMKKENNIQEINNIKERHLNDNNRSEYFSSNDEVKKTRYYKDNEDHIQNITKDVAEPQNPIEPESNKTPNSNFTTSSDNQNINYQDDIKETRKFKNIEERVHNITNESNVKEKHEKMITDQYQTTYQTDYSQRKISKDWSPTHQAWASTLRSDTPSRTTRGSSPGSKIYMSSTSSPRSSVSPDKICKKTPSRSGSPNKIDRNSPTRTISDKTYSSTQSSTYSVYETKSNRYTNDENSSQKNKSPTRQLYSPERKLQDEIRKRPSVSPEKNFKTPTNRPSISPQRKTRYPSDSDRHSPIRKIPTRTTPSPERQRPIEQQILPTFHSDERYEESDKIIQTSSQNIVTQITSNTTTHSEDIVENETSTLKNITKSTEKSENQPGYMRPTASSSPRNDSPVAPAKSVDSNRETSIKRTPSQSPERNYPVSKLDKVKEENNRFISEENKIHTSSKNNITSVSSVSHRKSPQKETSPDHHIKRSHQPVESPDRKLSSPIRTSPMKDTTDTIHNIKRFESPSFEDKYPEKSNDSTDLNRKLESYKQPSRELSPVKQTITSPSKKTPTKETQEDKSITPNKQPSRETSPLKRNGSPDKVYSRPIDNISMEGHANIPRYNEPRDSDKRLKNRSPSPNTNSDKQSSPIRNTISPSKESPKHKVTEVVEKTSINNKDDLKHQEIISKADTKLDTRTSRRSVSPKKPKLEDISSCKQTLDFIATERINEEINKTKLKERPRKLVTPSTSPTRKLKSEDTAPSTGQSSPTTTESGFVYFSSPRENILVTDLDDQEPTPTDSGKNLTNDICHKQPPRRTPSPTKIPCRSPSPEKVIIKESLPRKSSLKKPSIDNTNLISSVKPPTSFLISQNDEVKYEPDATQHTIENNLVKPIKNKPPLVRRETYEERCRKILGMTEEDSTATETKTIISHSKNCISSDTSPSISPCESPVQHEDKDFSQVKYETVDVLDITDSKYMQEKTGKPKEQLQTENLDFHSDVNSTQTVSEISKQISSKDSSKQISLPKIDDYDNNLCNSTSKTPKRKSSASPERPTLAPTHRARDIKKEISQGVEIYESETDTANINQMYTNITGTQNLTKNTETIDDYSQKTSESCKVIDTSSEFIVSEREQQILDRVQSSLRKLSPDRKAHTTKEAPDNIPEKTSSILPKTNVAAVSKNITRQSSDNIDKFTNISSEDKSTLKKDLTNEKLVTKSQIPSKPSSRNVSPIKKPPGSQNLPKNASENGKLRSASPKKPITHTDHKQGLPTEIPQSQIAKTTIGKTKDVISSQFHRTSSSSTIKNEKTNMTDTKKTLSNKQQTTRISPTKTNKTFSSNKPLDVENKRASTPKGIHRDLPHNIKKEADSKVIRTSSDIGMKTPAKKISAQRMKSKPDIYITASKVSKQATTTTAKHQKTSVKESTTKLPVSKPKSAIALNTSIDDEYVVIDVQQAKSSRENSPDRICPTPVGFSEDVGTPRFPDEVNEPDDEYNKYKNHIIHETESIVDDIVEISEEDELFVKRSEVDNEKIDTTDECLLSVYDKVTKFTNQVESHKPKDSTTRFKDTEKQIHSDFVDDNLKSDECLLSVSEKVNKFAKGSVGPKDRSPSRNITEEYDRDTVYTDDYTKLSVNDKAHLFIETAENVKTTKPKSIQKPERPNFTTVDDSLKSDECLLSVSDKVNKFVKTAEQVLSDTYVVDEKDKKIKEQHDKIMKQIVNDVEDNLTDVKKKSVPSKLYEPILDEEEKPDENESIHTVCQKLESNTNNIKTTIKSSEKPTPIKITTLRSSEAVKKAKALFENIASTSNTKEIHNKTTKLKDLGISKKITKSRSDTNESRKHVSNITAPTKDKQPTIQQTDYDEEQDKECLHQRQRSPDHDQKSKAPIIKEKSPITKITSPSTTRRDISPANRPVSPFTREKSPINRTLSPITREKSPTSKIRSPITSDKSPTTKTKSPAVKEDAPITRTKSPIPQVATITTKKVLSRFPITEQIDSQKQIPMENHDKPIDKVPGYQRPTRTSQIREEKHFEEVDVSSRRGSGKFGVELRRTSADRSSVSSERRRSSVEHHQPCIEDIFDLDLLEQMLEKVVGYEQRRRIRAQIRIAKKKSETEQEMTKVIRSSKQSAIKVTKAKSPERQPHRSPERLLNSQKPQSPERQPKITPNKTSSPDRQHKSTPKLPSYEQHEPKEPLMNGHAKEPNKILKDKETRPQSPEKQKSTMKTMRSSSPDKKSRPTSPSKTMTPKTKGNRFSEYASAYMKKVGLNESNKLKQTEVKMKKAPVVDEAITKRIETNRIVETHQVSKTLSDRTSSKDIIEIVQINGRKPQSPERSFDNNDGSDLTQQSRKQFPEGKPSDKTVSERKMSPERICQSHERQIDRHTSPKRSPSPVIKKVSKKETTTVLDIEKKIPQKQVQEEKPSWVTNRQLKKVTSDTRTFSSKKIEQEKPKYRPSSPSKAITKPIDVITSSYGPGPLDADGKPLFGIKALRNGATNYQVKGTVIRQEFHSRNGGEPEGTVSVTAYSTQPEDLEKLLQSQGEKPSRLHGLAAITTTKRFGGDTGTTLSELSTKEERAALDQFTHSDRRVTESKIERHTDTFDNREQKYTGKTEESERYGKEKQQDSSKRSKTESFKKETRRVDSDSQKETRAERMQKTERRVEDRKTVRQSSVKSLTEKFIKNASETSKTERTVYPKAGLILRTSGMKDSVSSDSSTHAGLARTDSEHSLGSVEDMVTTTTTTEQVGDVVRTTTTTTKTGGRTQERSFLDSSTKVTGVQDILTRMKNADIVIEEGDTNEDSEARALLNKFLGATVLMAGMQSYVTEKPAGHVVRQETVKTHSSSGGGRVSSSRKAEEFDLEQCWDERVLRKLLEECTDYELRRRLRARIRALMAEQEACASAVTEALAAAGETVESVDTEEHQQSGERGESLLLPLLQGLLQGGGEKLLAGLGTASHDVVADVRRSLQRLRLALAPPADHPQARALLALADRLEDALDVADRLDGCKRKPRRRSRTARHTVGVTREELEEARRIVDRDTLLPEPVKPSTSASSPPSSALSIESTTPERKQSVDEPLCYYDAIEVKHKPKPITHSVSYESTPKVNRDAQVVERRAPAPRRPDFFRHSIADGTAPDPPRSATDRWRSESKNGIAAIANKFDAKIEKEAPIPNKAPISKAQSTIQPKTIEEPRRTSYRPLPPTYNFAAPPFDDTSKPLNRSNNASKRLRMKRANTIDIGRPFGGYRFDNDDTNEDTNVSRAPTVPEFQPQTDNDKKFLAFMQKNEENGRNQAVGQANWSSRFGNIKNTFENREREEHSRSSSASSAKRFWQAADSSRSPITRPRKFLNETAPEIVKPPWVSQRRESLRSQVLPITKHVPQQTVQPPVILSPTKSSIVKPFVAKPIPVNQFSHAPMSAFKPPQKILSPTRAPTNIWSPPSSSIPVSPSVEHPPTHPSMTPLFNPKLSINSHQFDSESEKQRQVTHNTTMYESNAVNNHSVTPKSYENRPPTPPTHAQHTHSYPIKTIPSQNNLAAPELVKKIDSTNCYRSSETYLPTLDAQKLQIEFYEKQIREKSRREASSERRENLAQKPPPPPVPPLQTPYTIVDYTPNSASSFIPLQQTPDIEKAKAHKVDYLPDVVINEKHSTNYLNSPTTRVTSVSPIKPKQQQNNLYQNGEVRINGDDAATEHDSVVTKVMRGPVRGSAIITAGVRTRGAADSLRGVLDKLSSPKHDVISQIERKKRENARNQVRLAAPLTSSDLSPSHAISPTRSHAFERHSLSGSRSPALAASRESIFSSESPASRGSSPGSALTRSGSWHRLPDYASKPTSPRKVVARTKSMHLLAVPKLYEGGISQDEVLEKKRTVEAYFSGQTSANRLQQPGRPQAHTQAQFALGRSRTMPTVSELQFLDESNADDAFEDLVSALA